VAPKVLRPSSDFHVSLSLHGNAGSTNIVVAIEGQQDGGGPIRNTQGAIIEPNSTQIIKFQVFSFIGSVKQFNSNFEKWQLIYIF
jgi:CD109 antigen